MLNENEKWFVRNAIKNEVRMDSREIHLARKVMVNDLKCLGYDCSYQFSKGRSMIEVFVSFEENDVFLSQFMQREIKSVPSLTINYDLPFDLQKYFTDFFEETKLSLKLEIKVIKDDGSIISLIINAIKEIFSEINVPLFKPYFNELIKKYELPFAYEIAIVDNIFINDPNKKEEDSSDGVYLFLTHQSAVKEFIFMGRKGIGLSEINKNLTHIKNELLKK